MTFLTRAAALPAAGLLLMLAAGPAQAACGTFVTLQSHDATTVAYSLAGTEGGPEAVLVLLPGGSGVVDLDDGGCARTLTGNSLVRSREHFHRLGLATALLDAPSDHRGGDGLGGFRIAGAHAADIGAAIADLRTRTGLPVWLVGTSRGTISAVNAAARLTGPAAPDGLVLTSPITAGKTGGQKAWVAQTVFSVDLAAIRMPVLVVAHADDTCIRTPPARAGRILGETGATRGQTVMVTGGPGSSGGAGPSGGPSVEACRGKSPHGFVDQEAEVAEGVARFVRGGGY